MITYLTFDNVALGLSCIAVLLRLADRPRAASVVSSLCVLAATVGQWLAHRAQSQRRPERTRV